MSMQCTEERISFTRFPLLSIFMSIIDFSSKFVHFFSLTYFKDDLLLARVHDSKPFLHWESFGHIKINFTFLCKDHLGIRSIDCNHYIDH